MMGEGGGMLIIYSAGKEPVGGEYVRVKNKRIVTVLTHFFLQLLVGVFVKVGLDFFFLLRMRFFLSFFKRLIGVNLSKVANTRVMSMWLAQI